MKSVEIYGKTQLRITVQIVSLVGEEMIRNTENGQRGSLERLVEYLPG